MASIRQSDGKRTGFGLPRPTPGGQGYMVVNSPLMIMLMSAYRITDSQARGAPDWMFLKPTWDVEAKAERPSTPEQLREMFQNLLADRFDLRFHRKTKDMAAYILSVEKPGPKLKASDRTDPFQESVKFGDSRSTDVRVGTGASMSDLCWNNDFQPECSRDRQNRPCRLLRFHAGSLACGLAGNRRSRPDRRRPGWRVRNATQTSLQPSASSLG